MKLFKFFILILLSNYCFCQTKNNSIPLKVQKQGDGFEIKIKTKNLNKEKITINILFGTDKKLAVIDSVTVKSDVEEVVLKSPKKLIGAVYTLKIDSKPNTILLAIDNNTKFNLELDNNDISKIICSNSELNKNFIDFQNNEKSYEINKQIEIRQEEMKKYPLSVLNLYYKIENKLDETTPINEIERQKFYSNFFNIIDLNDRRLGILPNVYKMMYKYLNIIPVNNENYTKSIDNVLGKMDCSSKNYTIYTKWFITNLNFYESKNMEASFIHLFKKYIDIPNCKVLTEKELTANTNKYNAIMKMPLESKTLDFTMVDKDLKEFNLLSIYPENDYTFIAFFSPDCEHCKEAMPKVSLNFENLKLKFPNKKIKTISVLNDGDEKNWNPFIKEKNLTNWLNLKSLDKDRKYQTDFNAFSNPSYIMINKQGLIVLKSSNSKAFEEILSSN